jgi:hypothetical protein
VLVVYSGYGLLCIPLLTILADIHFHSRMIADDFGAGVVSAARGAATRVGQAAGVVGGIYQSLSKKASWKIVSIRHHFVAFVAVLVNFSQHSVIF